MHGVIVIGGQFEVEKCHLQQIHFNQEVLPVRNLAHVD